MIKNYGLPHPLYYYSDICTTAFDLITRGSQKDQDYYIDLLMNMYITFIETVIDETIQFNKANQKYYGKISFNSKVLTNQEKISYSGFNGERTK